MGGGARFRKTNRREDRNCPFVSSVRTLIAEYCATSCNIDFANFENYLRLRTRVL